MAVQTTTQHVGNTFECGIAGLVTEFVIDGLQPVEVDEQQTQALRAAARL